MRIAGFSLAVTLAGCVLVAGACGPAAQSPAASQSLPPVSPAPSTAPSPTSAGSSSGQPTSVFVQMKMPLQPITLGIPSDWDVISDEDLIEVDARLRAIDPAVADMYPPNVFEELGAIDLDALPGALSSVSTGYACDDTSEAVDRLEFLRSIAGSAPVDAAVIEMPAGEVAMVSFVRQVGPFMLRSTVYSYWAPTTDCDGTLHVVVNESETEPLLADAIARSVMLGSDAGVATLELAGAIVLSTTEFPIVCEPGGEGGTELRLSSGVGVAGMTLDLAVDAEGQPVFFQFAKESLLYFSGKGFDASQIFVAEPASTQARGAATFAGINPPDDPGHALSGRVTWNCG